MDRGWTKDGQSMDRGWTKDGERMDRGWTKDGQKIGNRQLLVDNELK
ncbi:MAG: hypothetical protein PHF97_01785 [Bacteroidales bacterium]|nr:hypothetical protein [Bacteroidales bacterium]